VLGGRDINRTSVSTDHWGGGPRKPVSAFLCEAHVPGDSCIGCSNESILLVRLLGRYFIYHTGRCRDFGFHVQRCRKEASADGYCLDTGGNSSSK
jgi:hypothetical protein